MIIDGVAASEAIDSSGEILDVKGCDISDLEEGRGVLNFEHKGEKDAGASFNDIIGRIIFAKKIYKESDCGNERERFYWNEVNHLPFIYIQCELFDQDGHTGAEAAAGMIRHYHKRSLPILVRYSIEGVTIQKEGNRLSKCIAKRVAATIKPCNKSCHSGVLEDPHDGFEAKVDETPDPIEELVDQAGAKKFEHPEYMKLGGAHEIELATPEMEKTLTAGNYNVAPGNLVGGAALQVSELSQRHNFLKAQALAAYRDWDKQTDFRKFIKMRLLDVDPGFIDHFVNLVEDYHNIKLKKNDENPAAQYLQEPPESVRPKYPDNLPKLAPQKERKPELKPMRKNGLRFEPNGTLITQKHQLQVHQPDITSKDAPYFRILYPTKSRGLSRDKKVEYLEKVHKPWLRAMSNWMVLNDAMREGRLPESVVYHAGMFSAMSPNTSVPVQELYYGHIMDLMHKHGFNPADPVHSEHLQYLKDMIAGGRLPEWQRQMYVDRGHKEGDGKQAGANNAPQILGFENYHVIHPYLMDLIHQHRDDGQQIVASLMDMKNRAQRAAKHRKSVDHAPVTGFGNKLARYLMLCAGAGNLLVPDRHMMRSLFNINPRTGGETLSHLTNVFEESTADKALRAIDQFFFEHHPATQFVLSKFPEHFKGREQQAIGPAFWLHWLATPHYEEAQGMANDNAQNAGTDHMPYWDSIRPQIEQIMRRYEIPFNESDQTAFDFGHNTAKSEEERKAPMACRTAHAMKEIEDRFGESAAHFSFHSYMVPVLMHANGILKKPAFESMVMKAQALTINLSKALADFKNTTPRGTFKLYDQSVEGEKRLVARFAIHDDQVQILEDTGVLPFESGIVTQKVHDAIKQLKETPNFKLTTVADENGEKYDAREQEPGVQVLPRAKAYYEFRIRGLKNKHSIEVNGNRVKYDGRSLHEDEIHEMMENVRSGIATLRLAPSPNMMAMQVAKMEKSISDIVALEKQEEKIDQTPNGLGNLYAWAMFKEDAPEDGVYAELNANDFSFVNSTHGSDVGDKAITAMGNAVRDTAKDVAKKAKVFRGASDSFHVWFPTKEDAHLFCRKLRTNLEQIPSIGGTHNLTASIGLGCTPEDANKAQAKAKRAKYAGGFKPGQAEQHVYSLVPGSEGLVPFEQLPPLKKPATDSEMSKSEPGALPVCPDCETFDGVWRTGRCDICHGDGGNCGNCGGTGSPRCCRCEGSGWDLEDPAVQPLLNTPRDPRQAPRQSDL